MFEFNASVQKVERLQQIESDAVLDQKWFNGDLVTATSLGNVEIYKFKNSSLEMNCKISLDSSSHDCLALSFDVDAIKNRILASDSYGRLTLIDESSEKILMQWKCHDYESWTCAFDKWNNNIVYSGKFVHILILSGGFDANN